MFGEGQGAPQVRAQPLFWRAVLDNPVQADMEGFKEIMQVWEGEQYKVHPTLVCHRWLQAFPKANKGDLLNIRRD